MHTLFAPVFATASTTLIALIMRAMMGPLSPWGWVWMTYFVGLCVASLSWLIFRAALLIDEKANQRAQEGQQHAD